MKRRRGVPHVAGVWLLTIALVTGAYLLLRTSPNAVPAGAQFRLPWWLLIPAFAFALTFRVNFEFRDQSRSLLLDQVFLLLGLYFCSTEGTVAARVIGLSIAVALRRQPPAKFALNVASFAIATVAAERVFRLAWAGGVVSAHSWPAAFLAILANQLVTYLAVVSAVGITQRRWSWREVAGPLPFETLSTLVVVCLAIVGATALAYDPPSGWVFAAGLAVTLIGFRGYNQVLARHRALEHLHAFARQLGPVVADPSDLGPTLVELRRMLHADRLELALLDVAADTTVFTLGGDEAELQISARPPEHLSAAARNTLASPQGSLLERPRSRQAQGASDLDDAILARVGDRERPVGLLTAAHRSGPARRFDRSDLRLLEAIANQLGGALEKGRLLENLRRAATHDSLTG
ncbi:MAG: GAF domain-containing protein, partial [Mycobacteriales bacterium]